MTDNTSITVRGLNVLIYGELVLMSKHILGSGTCLDKSTIDDILDSIDRDTGLGDIGREDNLSRIPWRRIKDQCLFLGRKASVEG